MSATTKDVDAARSRLGVVYRSKLGEEAIEQARSELAAAVLIRAVHRAFENGMRKDQVKRVVRTLHDQAR
jgi:hypothetical protein